MAFSRKDGKSSKIRALQVVSLGDPCGPLDGSVLKLGHVFAPPLAAIAIRIRIRAASLNFADLLQAQVRHDSLATLTLMSNLHLPLCCASLQTLLAYLGA